jgi:hypothetical protein
MVQLLLVQSPFPPDPSQTILLAWADITARPNARQIYTCLFFILSPFSVSHPPGWMVAPGSTDKQYTEKSVISQTREYMVDSCIYVPKHLGTDWRSMIKHALENEAGYIPIFQRSSSDFPFRGARQMAGSCSMPTVSLIFGSCADIGEYAMHSVGQASLLAKGLRHSAATRAAFTS